MEKIKVVDALVNAKVVISKSEARRMIAMNAVSLNGEKVADLLADTVPGDTIKAGKRTEFVVE